MNILRLTLLVFMVVQVSFAGDTTSYVYTPVVEKNDNTTSIIASGNCTDVLLGESLLHQKVVFNTLTLNFQHYGYQSWKIRDHESVSFIFDNEYDHWHEPQYKDLVGKVGTIVKIGTPDSIGSRDVLIQLDGTNEIVRGSMLDDSISDVTLLKDILYARKKWLGKTIWNLHSFITTPDLSNGFATSRKFQPVIVKDVVVGHSSNKVDFVLEFPNHEIGIIGVTVSLSNESQNMLKIIKTCSFDSFFAIEDPHKQYNFTANVWHAIENSKVLIGMNAEQVILSLGYPKDMNTLDMRGGGSHDQWVYSDEYIYLDNGVVTAIQSHE